MFTVRIDQNTNLVVDFEGLLSPREEEVTAYRFAGNNKEAVSKIIGTAPDTINKQQRKAYVKTDVDGTDNPLALLMCKAFQNGWAKFAALMIILSSSGEMIRTQARLNAVRARPQVVRMIRKISETGVTA